jgi:mono/diheme cytochrome c family protein
MQKIVSAFSVIVLLAVVVATAPKSVAAAEDPAAALYNKKCAMCHGKDGVAKKMGAGSANLNDPEWKKANSAETITKITAEGSGKMPKYSDKLTADEIKAIADYILTLE